VAHKVRARLKMLNLASSAAIQKNSCQFYAVGNGETPDNVFIRYDSRAWDIVERFGRRAVGKTYVRFRKLYGIWIPRSEWQVIRALAMAEGAVS
jgi:hypothetical protein